MWAILVGIMEEGVVHILVKLEEGVTFLFQVFFLSWDPTYILNCTLE
jgi:hypothetical protein